MEKLKLHAKQSIIAKDKHRFRVVCCGRRFGKTTLAVSECVAKSVIHSNQRIAFIAPTYPQARDIAWQEFKKVLPASSSANPEYNESRLEITLNNGSHIWLRGWENIESIRGQRFDYLVIDEVAMMKNFPVMWQEVVRPTLTDTRGHCMFISTPKGFNHFYDLYNLEDEDEDYKSFHFRTEDNPFIPYDEIEKAEKELTEDRFAQEYKADFRKTEGLVYKEFSRTRHIYNGKTRIPEFIECLVGVDFGYNNPSAVVVIHRDKDNNYWITDEWYKTQQTTAQIIEVVQAYAPHAVYADPAEPDRIMEMKRKGVNVRDVVKGKNSINSGIDTIRELFKQERIKILPNCKNLIWELETYHYKEKPMGESDEPEKENDHALDALRYALMMNSKRAVSANQFKPLKKTNFA